MTNLRKNVGAFVQDQTTEPIDLYLCNEKGSTTPTAAIAVDDKTVSVASVTGAVVGECINIREGTRFFQSLITDITALVITFASPADFAFTTDAEVCFGQWDVSTANGSVTPVIFEMRPPSGAAYDIYRLSISMEDNAVMYESTFGGITQLANGLVGRVKDGYYKNLFVVVNNGGFREYGFLTEYPSKVPSGSYAFWGDKGYSDGNGVALRLDGSEGDSIQIIVQDNLTDITNIAVTAHGHVVED